MDTSKRGYKLVQLCKQSAVLQDLTNSLGNNQHQEFRNIEDKQPEIYDGIQNCTNYDLLEECRLADVLFNNNDILLLDASTQISTSFVNNIIEGEDNRWETVQEKIYDDLNAKNIDSNELSDQDLQQEEIGQENISMDANVGNQLVEGKRKKENLAISKSGSITYEKKTRIWFGIYRQKR